MEPLSQSKVDQACHRYWLIIKAILIERTFCRGEETFSIVPFSMKEDRGCKKV